MKEYRNKFLDNETITNDKIYTSKSGSEIVTLMYPNNAQKTWIKNKLYENRFRIMENAGLLSKETEVYRYILKNLCNLDGISKYDDIELIDILTNGKVYAKRLKNKIDDLMYELFDDAIEESKISINALNTTLSLIDVANDEYNTNKLLDNILNKSDIDTSDVKTVEDVKLKIEELTNENNNYKQQIDNFSIKEEDYKKQLQEKDNDIKSLKISNYDYFCKLTQQNKVVDNIDNTDDKEEKEEFETLDDLLKEEFK